MILQQKHLLLHMIHWWAIVMFHIRLPKIASETYISYLTVFASTNLSILTWQMPMIFTTKIADKESSSAKGSRYELESKVVDK